MGARGPRNTTKFNVTLPSDLGSVVLRYADDHQLTAIEAIRELVQIGLSASPSDAAIMAAKQRGYATVRSYAAARLSDSFKEIAADIERTFSDPSIFRG